MDLNCDMGEDPVSIADGSQEALMPFLTSVNIACGGHAGDERTMQATVEQALRWKLSIGAHPGYPDPANFGRVEMDLSMDAVERTVYEQIRALARFAFVVHVKPHGALYNRAAKDPELARAIARGTARFSKDVILVGLAGSSMLDVFREEGFRTAAEAFADRRYEPDGTLRSRKFEDALIHDPQEAAAQALRIARNRNVQTICIHSDTPGALEIAREVKRTLQESGIELSSAGHRFSWPAK